MPNDFWAKRLAGIATPQPQQPAPNSGGAWWQDSPPQPRPQELAPGTQFYPTQYGQQGYNPALQAQMPGQGYGQGDPGSPAQREQYIRQLRRVKNAADALTQEQMEEIAEWELANEAKYNTRCPQCDSANFVPAGTVIQGKRMGSDKCFDCGASSSTYTSSPEPASGGGGKTSKAPYRDVRQIDTGGANGESMYLAFDGVPAGYMPRGS